MNRRRILRALARSQAPSQEQAKPPEEAPDGVSSREFLLYAKWHTIPFLRTLAKPVRRQRRRPKRLARSIIAKQTREIKSPDAANDHLLFLTESKLAVNVCHLVYGNLAQSFNQTARRGRVRVSLRVNRPLFEHLVGISRETATSRAGLSQVFIILGFVETSLELENPESKQAFLLAVRTHQKLESVGPNNPHAGILRNLSEGISILPIRRGRERRHLGGSRIILVRLPSRLLDKIDRHARLIGATRTALLTHLLQRGLILYLRSQLALAKAHHEALKIANAPESSE